MQERVTRSKNKNQLSWITWLLSPPLPPAIAVAKAGSNHYGASRGWPHSSITEIPWGEITCTCLLQPPARTPSTAIPRVLGDQTYLSIPSQRLSLDTQATKGRRGLIHLLYNPCGQVKRPPPLPELGKCEPCACAADWSDPRWWSSRAVQSWCCCTRLTPRKEHGSASAADRKSSKKLNKNAVNASTLINDEIRPLWYISLL